jgi:prepilin-type N-terminal cleavage/methylation domain-containing protein
MGHNRAFTLVEIMIGVAIIGLLAAIGLPSFLAARQKSQNAKLIASLRVAVDGFEMYAADHNQFPPGLLAGKMPTGMDAYLEGMRWTEETPVGGLWQWQGNASGSAGYVTIVKPTAPVEQMREIDAKIDDGDENTGTFQISNGRWRYAVE